MLSEREGMVHIRESRGQILSSSGYVRGAAGTRNFSWQQSDPNDASYPFPCSIGASVEGGYVTAGHCGAVTYKIRTATGQSLGEVKGSTYSRTWGYSFGEDSGWVETDPGWTPSPQIHGYDEGNFFISSNWSGKLEAPVGGTVCRYGQTSSGPHCGQILEKGKDFPPALYGFTTASGEICTQDGDSGGPYLTPSRQMQGINFGAVFPENEDDPDAEPENTCYDAPPPIPPYYVIFQPIQTTLNRFNRTMLTPHGPNPPVVTSATCPDLSLSGFGQYVCYVNNVNSQGGQDFSWTSNTGHSSNQLGIQGSCPTGSPVHVSLQTTNPYGTSLNQYSFTCP